MAPMLEQVRIYLSIYLSIYCVCSSANILAKSSFGNYVTLRYVTVREPRLITRNATAVRAHSLTSRRFSIHKEKRQFCMYEVEHKRRMPIMVTYLW